MLGSNFKVRNRGVGSEVDAQKRRGNVDAIKRTASKCLVYNGLDTLGKINHSE